MVIPGLEQNRDCNARGTSGQEQSMLGWLKRKSKF